MSRIFQKHSPGISLIELMVAIAIIGVFLSYFVPNMRNNQVLAESEVRFQLAVRALRNQVEVLRTTLSEDMKAGEAIPFDPRGKGLEQLVGGRGVVIVEQYPDAPLILLLRVEVHWRDPRFGMRSIHTILMKS